ncbi:MAG TPA: choice-of-anchor V domain-containing protein [Bacteroidia bacterium]|jgi:hypothetical protein|nr:choice-of-anchor V domain-containing protein [Bacteroidia bacterium]
MKIQTPLKKIIILLTIIGVQQLLTSSMLLKIEGAHEGSTGAPNEKTCAQSGCHKDATVSPGTLVNQFIFNGGDSLYTPGETYPVKIQVNKAGIKRFGFQVTVLRSSDNSYVGTLIATDAAKTQLQNGIAPNATRKYITHKTAGTDAISTGIGEWTFQWKAPATNVGAIKFYYATNATNMDNENTGDQVFLSTFQIKPKTTTGIEASVKEEFFNAYYSTESRQLIISYDNLPGGRAKIELRNMEGQLIQSSELSNSTTSAQNVGINLNSTIASGVYLITYRVNNTMLSRKIYIHE